jgi:hypothetical protein
MITPNCVLTKRLQFKDTRAGYQRPDHLKVRVLGRSANQRDHAALDMRQQRILLGLIPAVNLIDKQDRAAVVHLATLGRLCNHLTQVGYTCQHRRDGFKMGL